MDAKDMDLLITLKTKEKLTPTEKATLKNLQRTANKEGEKEEKQEVEEGISEEEEAEEEEEDDR